MKSTVELMREYGVPLPASMWTDQGLDVPEFQQVGESNRLVKTPGYMGPETQEPQPAQEPKWQTNKGLKGQHLNVLDIMPDEMDGVIRWHSENKPAPVEGAVCGVGGPPVVDISVSENGLSQSFTVTPSGTTDHGVKKEVYTISPEELNELKP